MTSNEVVIEKAPRLAVSSDFYLVKRKTNGVIVGFLEKYKNTRTETHPWKAFGIKNGIVNGDQFKAFYAADGGKAAAIEQVIAFYEGR